MTVDETQQRRASLADEIQRLVVEFETVTGCDVASIYLGRIERLGERDIPIIKLDVRLP